MSDEQDRMERFAAALARNGSSLVARDVWEAIKKRAAPADGPSEHCRLTIAGHEIEVGVSDLLPPGMIVTAPRDPFAELARLTWIDALQPRSVI